MIHIHDKEGKSRYEKEAYCTFQGVWFPKDLVNWRNGKPICPFCGYRARTHAHIQHLKTEQTIQNQ